VLGCFVSVFSSEDGDERFFVEFLCGIYAFFLLPHVVLLPIVTPEIPVPRRAASDGSAHG